MSLQQEPIGLGKVTTWLGIRLSPNLESFHAHGLSSKKLTAGIFAEFKRSTVLFVEHNLKGQQKI